MKMLDPAWLASWGMILLKNIRWIVFPFWTEGWLTMHGILVQSVITGIRSTASDIVQVVSQDVFVPANWLEHHQLLAVCSGLTVTIFSTLIAYTVFSRCRSLNFMNTVYKMLVLAYPTLTRLALAYLIDGGDERATNWSLDFLCGLLVLLYTCGFPWYVFTLVRSQHATLYHVQTLDRMGCLYMDFKPARKHFMLVLFLVQLAYAGLQLASHLLTLPAWTVSLLQVGVETAYVCTLLGLKPYAKRELQLESVTSTILKLTFSFGTTFFHYYGLHDAAGVLVLLMTIVLLACHVGFSCANKVWFARRRRKLSIEMAHQHHPDLPLWVVKDYLQDHARVKPLE